MAASWRVRPWRQGQRIRYACIQEIGGHLTGRLVVVRRFPALVHAELAKSALAASEIAATIHDEGYRRQGLRAELGPTVTLLVREDDVAAALEILGPPDERYSE